VEAAAIALPIPPERCQDEFAVRFAVATGTFIAALAAAARTNEH
jgi:hypothetical protein